MTPLRPGGLAASKAYRLGRIARRDMAMAQYFVQGSDNVTYGPVDEAGLVQWARQGRLVSGTPIRCGAAGPVVLAGSLPFMAAALAPAGAIAPGGYYDPYNQIVPPNTMAARMHRLEMFSVAGMVLLSIVTFGIFPLIWLGLMHDKMPRTRLDDPSAGKAIGFMFIPFFNFYWQFFNYLRLCDRINDQRTMRGLAPSAPRGLAMASCIMTLIPYVNILGCLIIEPIFVGMLQASVNELVLVTARQAQAACPA